MCIHIKITRMGVVCGVSFWLNVFNYYEKLSLEILSLKIYINAVQVKNKLNMQQHFLL